MSDTRTLHTGHLPHAGFFPTVTRLALGFMRLVYLARERRALAELERHRLDDLGIDPEAARAEAARRFWDAPPHWRL
jgi:uncharacterized protein YjiS (DUF1127 family)